MQSKSILRRLRGEPTYATTGGKRAGASSALDHAVSYNGMLSSSPFHHLITSSPGLHRPAPYNKSDVQLNFDQLATRARCAPGTTADLMGCLRQVPVSKISEASIHTWVAGLYTCWTFNVVQDGHLLMDYPSWLVANKRVNRKRMLTGSKAEAAPLFVPQNLIEQSDVEEWLGTSNFTGTTHDLDRATNHYLPVDEDIDSNVRFVTDGFGLPFATSAPSTVVGVQSVVDTLQVQLTYVFRCAGFQGFEGSMHLKQDIKLEVPAPGRTYSTRKGSCNCVQ